MFASGLGIMWQWIGITAAMLGLLIVAVAAVRWLFREPKR